MARTTDFNDLPGAILEMVADLAGSLVEFNPAPSGNHADVAGELRTSDGRVFIKGARLLPGERFGGPEAWSLRNEAAILPHVQPHAPKLYWQVEVEGWYLLGFEYVDGRHADYAPGSPDLELVANAVENLGKVECPPTVRLRVEDRYKAIDHRASVFSGSGLLHCDINPSNVLIDTDGAVRIVDWAFTSRGAAWLEYGFLVPWLLRDGHSPGQAETWLAQFPTWKTAEPWHVDLFAGLLARAWARRNTEGAPTWVSEYASLVWSWNESRQAGGELYSTRRGDSGHAL